MHTMSLPKRRTAELRKGRVSLPGARYFISACTANRRPAFSSPRVAAIARNSILRLAEDRDVEWLAATVMPNHLHLLFALGCRLSLDRTLAKLKGVISRNAFPGGQDPLWQESAFERRLRPEESTDDYGLYVFMNPYRAGLVSLRESWPWWVCTEPSRFAFLDAVGSTGIPRPEWLIKSDAVAKLLGSA
jgi:REP element-mobilizing transposase RayT